MIYSVPKLIKNYKAFIGGAMFYTVADVVPSVFAYKRFDFVHVAKSNAPRDLDRRYAGRIVIIFHVDNYFFEVEALELYNPEGKSLNIGTTWYNWFTPGGASLFYEDNNLFIENSSGGYAVLSVLACFKED